jgi:hypothetical protein
MLKFIVEKLLNHFKNKLCFSKHDLLEFFHTYEPELNMSTFNSRLRKLLNENIISEIKSNCYIVSSKPKFTPNLSDELIKIDRILKRNFDNLEYSIWSTGWFNYFSRHQLGQSITILEVDRDLIEIVFNVFKDLSKNVLINPGTKEMEYYSDTKEIILILPLIARAPKQKIIINNQKVTIPRLEKILVDIFCDKNTYYMIQGSELVTVFDNAVKKYTINFSKLFSYADRRGRKMALKEFILDNIDDEINEYL